MSLYTLPIRPPYPIITCRVSPVPEPTVASPPPSLLPPATSATAVPSLTCVLQCPHFESCSGCTHEFNLHRPVIVDEASNFFKSLGVSDFTFDSCRLWGWRCRAKLAVRGLPENPLIGLYEEGSHNVVDIPRCKGIRELNIEPYDEDEGTGDLRYVQMAVTTYNTALPAVERYRNGRVQVSLVWNSRNEKSSNSDKLSALANFLWRNAGSRSNLHLIHSVWANFQTSTNNIIFGNRWRHLLGERDFWEHVGGIDISLDPSSFGQANTRAFDNLLRKLHKYVPFGASVADLYAGAGVIGLSLAATKKSVKCIEINKESRTSFEKSVDRLPKSIEGSISWHNADTSIDPLSWLVGSDVIVVDPPRKGLDTSLIDALRTISSHKVGPSLKGSSSNIKEEKRPWVLREMERSKEASVQVGRETISGDPQSLPETLIYISCGWESFKEDCKALLTSKSWRLEKAHGFNFFPGTQSIEVLAVFKRSLKKKKTGKKKKKQG
ncbi:putative LRR receptor-like serine/threonine-protein kinase [Hibiscus syriacus]|uniref:LRR receptor-like serine/threonine-protein kinase n=1 Tax=Hibiscus syriacus TaxID=106335 RepID=A0A6A2YNE0_HIBSY|nr:putative LRR receptor-like serine/threonine-protein kinase [Hibiscus syriacus]